MKSHILNLKNLQNCDYNDTLDNCFYRMVLTDEMNHGPLIGFIFVSIDILTKYTDKIVSGGKYERFKSFSIKKLFHETYVIFVRFTTICFRLISSHNIKIRLSNKIYYLLRMGCIVVFTI